MPKEDTQYKKGNLPPRHKFNCLCFRCTRISPNKGKIHSQKIRDKISCKNKGKIQWNKGLTKFTNKLVAEIGEKTPKKLIGQRHSVERIKKSLRRRPMSTLEIKFLEIVNKNKLPYKFVGNGKFFIERKNPDFINCNGEKIAIEVFYRDHKEKFTKYGFNYWKLNREKIFSNYGWRLLFFNEVQVNETFVLSILGDKDS